MYKKIVGILICILLIFNILPASANIIVKGTYETTIIGNTLYVGGSGPGNYTRIQDAIDNASSGDTVFVYDESSPYYEHVNVHNSINLIGENIDTTMIINNSADELYTVSITTAGNASIKGFTIKGHTGIQISSSNNSILYNNITGIQISSSNNSILYNNITRNPWAVNFEGGSNNNIEGNTIFASDLGIFSYGEGYHNSITNNIIQSGNTDIRIYQGNNYLISNNTLRNRGLWLQDSWSHIVSNNTVDGKPLIYLDGVKNEIIDYPTGQIFLINCDNVTIKNQDFFDIKVGIQVYGSKNCNIFDNVINGPSPFYVNGFGIEIRTSSNIKVSNNYIKYLDAIDIHDCKNIIISNNNIIKNRLGIFLDQGLNITISYNKIFNSCLQFYYGCRNSTVSHNNLISNNFIDRIYQVDIFDPKFSNNTWDNNYWGRPRLFPKCIPCAIYEGEWPLPDSQGSFYFDWHPARKPFDIS